MIAQITFPSCSSRYRLSDHAGISTTSPYLNVPLYRNFFASRQEALKTREKAGSADKKVKRVDEIQDVSGIVNRGRPEDRPRGVYVRRGPEFTRRPRGRGGRSRRIYCWLNSLPNNNLYPTRSLGTATGVILPLPFFLCHASSCRFACLEASVRSRHAYASVTTAYHRTRVPKTTSAVPRRIQTDTRHLNRNNDD